MERTPPPFFNRGPSPVARLFLCALLSCALLVSDARYRYLEYVREGAIIALYPLQWLAAAPYVLANHVSDLLSSRAALREQNTSLEDRRLHDAVDLQQLRALRQENTHLRDLLAMRARYPDVTLAAEIAYSDRDPFTQKIVVDKGERHGVKPGQPVIDRVGVIGQVTRVYPWLSEITLITDSKQTVPVQNLRNGLRAVLAGTGASDRLELKFIALSADFAEGDVLVTSGIDGVYPPGLPVGVVAAVERNPNEMFARIRCAPLAGVYRQRQVLIVNWQNPAPPLPPGETARAPMPPPQHP